MKRLKALESQKVVKFEYTQFVLLNGGNSYYTEYPNFG